MLTGDPPHAGNTIQAIIAKVLSEEPTPIARTRKLVPANVAAAVQRALAKIPADRFATATQFAEALADSAFTLPSAAGVAKQTTSSRLWRRLALWFLVLATLLLVAALWGWLRSGPPQPVLRYSMTMPEEEALSLQVQSSVATRLALSPDGSRLVYVGPGDAAMRLWVRSRDQLHAAPLPGTEGGTQPFFSPDGQGVAFFTVNPTELRVISLRGGSSITVGGGFAPRGGSWGPDGFLYIGDAGGRGVLRVPVNGGVLEPATRPDPARGEFAHFWPEVLPNGRGMVFTVTYGGGVEGLDIAVADLATGEHRVLLRAVSARYAASGHLVYVTADGTLMAAQFDQEALALTGKATSLIEGLSIGGVFGAVDLALSATGTLMYVSGQPAIRRGALVSVARDGTEEEIDPDWIENFGTPALSPDGRRLAVSIIEGGRRDVWIMQLDGGAARAPSKLTFVGNLNYRVAWSPNGREVLFVSNRNLGADLFVKRWDGSAPAELLLHRERPVFEGLWSSDGAWLIYRTDNNAPGRGDILAIRPDVDSVPVELVATEFEEHSPTLSPDDRWLAYVSNEEGRTEVYVRPFPEAGEGVWRVSEDGGVGPLWAHSGRELFYRNASGQMVVAEVQAGPAFAVGRQRALFSTADYLVSTFVHQTYDVTPDDQRFVMVRDVESDYRGELIVVENFFEELKARVGN
jgi:serine/threonine-protein kinase